MLFNMLKHVTGDLNLDIAIASGIVSVGPPSAYALVWEYGNVRQTKPGPKTTLAVDIDSGKKVWLTIQAPHGYVRILRPIMRSIMLGELSKVRFGQKRVKQQLMEAWNRIGEQCAALVKTTVPVDKADLKESITWLKPRQAQDLSSLLANVKGAQ